MFLILWTPAARGKENYAVPDAAHGDVHPGPYPTLKEAWAALDLYISTEIDVHCQEGYADNFEIRKLEGPCRRLKK